MDPYFIAMGRYYKSYKNCRSCALCSDENYNNKNIKISEIIQENYILNVGG
jgi:hypothetical protein